MATSSSDDGKVLVDRTALVKLLLIAEGLRDALGTVDAKRDWAAQHAGYIQKAVDEIAQSVGFDVAEDARKYADNDWLAALSLAFDLDA